MFCSVCQLPVAEADQPSDPSFRTHECPFCSTVFSRVDGARRHAKCCPQRAGRALNTKKRGRKAKACDQCSRVKVHCDARSQSPCHRCISRKLDCTFGRCCTNTVHRQPTHEEELPVSQEPTSGRVPLSFLLNVTDDKQDFITERAVGEEPDGVLLGPTGVSPPPQVAPLRDNTFDYIDPTLLLPSDSQAYLAPLELGGLYNTEEQNLLGAFLSPQSQADLLSARLDLLESDIAAYASCSDYHRGSFDKIAFRRFFSVSNVHTFATIFCRKRHYQYPIIHWPTFALEEASLPLLMVVSLTGATYSYRPGHGPDHVTDARKLYHLADSYVFHQLAICLHRMPVSDVDLSEVLQLCQAALLMFALDTLLTGDSDLQKTAMTERLPALISAMRRLQFFSCRHHPSEDWQLFLHREQIIRLVSWTFCADCLATWSCNNPPIFSLQEMIGDLPCDLELWDADSASAFDMLRSSRQGPSHCLKDLMSRLLHDGGRGDVDLENLPLFHLHVMLCAFQQIIFNLHVTMFLSQKSRKLLHTLDTWRHLWGRAMDKIPNNHRERLGVTKNVPAIEYLSRRIIEVAVSPEAGSSRYLRRIPSYGSREIHEFIRDFISPS